MPNCSYIQSKLKDMPSKKYIITVLGGTWNGFKVVKYSRREADSIINNIEENFGLKCNLEIIDLH
jgi:hypothetical protein